LSRFNRVFWTNLLPVRIDYYRTDCLFRARFGLSSLQSAIGSLLSLNGRSRHPNCICQIVSDRPGTGVFQRRHYRGHHHRAFALFSAVCRCPAFFLCVQG
jgi:hypothetical protein